MAIVYNAFPVAVRPMRKDSSERTSSTRRRAASPSRQDVIVERRTITAHPRSRPIQLFSRHKREQMKRHLRAAASAAREEDDDDEPRHKVVKVVSKSSAPPPPVSNEVIHHIPEVSVLSQEEPGMEEVVQHPQPQLEEEEFELVMGPEGLDWQDEEDEEIQHRYNKQL